MRKILFLVLLLAEIHPMLAQNETDSLARQAELQTAILTPSDSVNVQDSILVKESDYPNPKKAALLSLVIPGAGHIYNKRGTWWKLPLTLGALGGAIVAIDYNGKNYRLLQDAYCTKLINSGARDSTANPCTALSNYTLNNLATYNFLVESPNYTSASLRSLRDKYDKQYQLSWIGLVIGHLVLNGAWSFVDAHLNDFDINDDLSIQIQPRIETTPTFTASGVRIGVTLTF